MYKTAPGNSQVVCETTKFPTGRTCQVCGGEIHRVFQTEIDKRNGETLSSICVWDQRLTCSGSCRAQRETAIAMSVKCINGEYPIVTDLKEAVYHSKSPHERRRSVAGFSR
jgi:hypothetical protein